MPIFLHGLALQYYRGIGPNVQKLRPFKDFNFFIGANNAGKSTVLDFISKYLLAGPKRPVRMSPLEQYRGEKTGTPTAAVGVPVQTFIQSVYKRIGAKAENNNVKEAVPKISGLLADGDFIWIALPFGQFPGTSYLAGQPSATAFRKVLADHQLSNLWSSLTGAGGGGIEEHWIPQTLATLLNAQQESLTFPEVQLIPALRQIGPKSEKFADFSGRGLIDRLAEIQSPDHDKREERLIFDRINKFLQTVTGRVSAQIEVPHNREHILVHMDNKVLPLLSLGTGTHEVIMIAAFCTISENQIVCIEEPEIHLHRDSPDDSGAEVNILRFSDLPAR